MTESRRNSEREALTITPDPSVWDFEDPRRFGPGVTSESLPVRDFGRFPPLPPGREAEIRREAAMKLRQLTAPKPRFASSNQPEATFTYLVGVAGSEHVKIGYAKEPEKRVAYLQTGSPMELTLLWAEEGVYEALLHREFHAYRVRGEWFDFSALGDPVEVVAAAVKRIKESQQ